jgi:uncharacterized protein (DUF1778 family)
LIKIYPRLMNKQIKDQTRFDARLPKEQKELFEKAAILGGFRNLTDFILLTAQEKAKAIIQEKEQILASNRDCEIFFDALTNQKKPSETLKNALRDYNEFISNSK